MMFTPKFIEGAKDGLMRLRSYTYDAEIALDTGDIHEVQKAMAMAVGHAINLQAAVAAKIIYELSEAEAKADQ